MNRFVAFFVSFSLIYTQICQYKIFAIKYPLNFAVIRLSITATWNLVKLLNFLNLIKINSQKKNQLSPINKHWLLELIRAHKKNKHSFNSAEGLTAVKRHIVFSFSPKQSWIPFDLFSLLHFLFSSLFLFISLRSK